MSLRITSRRYWRWVRWRWPDQDLIHPFRQSWLTPQRGGCIAAGVRGMFTGKGYSLGIIDDPCKGPEDPSHRGSVSALLTGSRASGSAALNQARAAAAPHASAASQATCVPARGAAGDCLTASPASPASPAAASAAESPCRRQCPGPAAPRYRANHRGQHLETHRPPQGRSGADRNDRHPAGCSA